MSKPRGTCTLPSGSWVVAGPPGRPPSLTAGVSVRGGETHTGAVARGVRTGPARVVRQAVRTSTALAEQDRNRFGLPPRRGGTGDRDGRGSRHAAPSITRRTPTLHPTVLVSGLTEI